MSFIQHPVAWTAKFICELTYPSGSECKTFTSSVAAKVMASTVFPALLAGELLMLRSVQYLKNVLKQESDLQTQALHTMAKLANGIFKSGFALAQPKIACIDFLSLEDRLVLGLEEWVQHRQDEERLEAKARILDCFSSHDSDLDLSDLNLSSLPKELGLLTHIEELDLSSNALNELPIELKHIKGLRVLDVSFNALETLPSIFMNMRELTTLCASHNNLTALPESLACLEALEELDLRDNQITALSDDFSHLRSLKKLLADRNRITHVSLDIGQLSELKSLYLDFNPLETLPESFGDLSQLETLYMYGNCLLSIPACFSRLKKLSIIRVNLDQLEMIEDLVFPHRDVDDLIFIPHPEQNSSMHRLDVRQPQRELLFLDLDARSHALQQVASSSTLFDLLSPWFTLASITSYESSFWESLETNQSLKTFIARLETAAWFEKGSNVLKASYAKLLIEILSAMTVDNSFRTKAFETIEESLSSCSDRIAWGFDKLALTYDLYIKCKGKSDLELAAFLIGATRSSMIDDKACALSSELSKDTLELTLFIHIETKALLKLPQLSFFMNYSSLAGLSKLEALSVGEDILEKTSQKQDLVKLLASHPFWQERLRDQDKETFDRFIDQASWDVNELLFEAYSHKTSVWIDNHFEHLKELI